MKYILIITFILVMILYAFIIAGIVYIIKLKKELKDIHEVLSSHKDAALKLAEKVNTLSKNMDNALTFESNELSELRKKYTKSEEMHEYKYKKLVYDFNSLTSKVKIITSKIEKAFGNQ